MEEIVSTKAPKKKRLALFLDGTWNAVGTNTNVWRLRSLCADMSSDGARQLRYYDEGVNGVVGGGWGRGVGQNVCQAYEWLVENFEFGDEIFIFGFSRGAFTARSLAGFIAMCGLIKPGGALGVNQLYDRYRREPDRTIYKLLQTTDYSHEEKWMLKYSRAVPIQMVGVWDTVGALGVPMFHIPGISSSTLGFFHTGLRQSIKHGFHAVAIDEHRKKFAPTLWTIKTLSDAVPKSRAIDSVEQRWFIGAHANVGGGCYNDLLAQIPLRWIMRKATRSGLTFRNDIEIDGDEFVASVSDSFREFLHGAYSLCSKRFYRPIGAAPMAVPDGIHTNVNETIDGSVFKRWRKDSTYRPPNLSQWAKDRGVDLNQLEKAVRADDPTISVPD